MPERDSLFQFFRETSGLVEINSQLIIPPEQSSFPIGTVSSLTVLKRDGRQVVMNVSVPKPRWRKQPFAEPRTVSFAELDGHVAYLKTTIAPGLAGVDIAWEFDADGYLRGFGLHCGCHCTICRCVMPHNYGTTGISIFDGNRLERYTCCSAF